MPESPNPPDLAPPQSFRFNNLVYGQANPHPQHDLMTPSSKARRYRALSIFLLVSTVSTVAHSVAASRAISDPQPATAKEGMPVIGETPLPEQVPYLNKKEYFFIGNGVAGAGGTADGKWDFLVGPDYTCPNYLSSEEISLVVDGAERSVTMNVHRARNTGIFYGVTSLGDLEVYLIDHGGRGKPWTARLVMIKNRSTTAAHKVSIRAHVTPQTGDGRSASFVRDSSGRAAGLSLKLDTSLNCMGNRVCQNWAFRYALVTFNDPATTVTKNGGTFNVDSGTTRIAPGGSCNAALYHYMHYKNKTDSDYIDLTRKRNGVRDAEGCIHEWQSWFAGVDAKYSLDHIKDQRARDIVEGGLAIIKMNQARDGGIVSNERAYDLSYVRDAYCGLRGLSATGHFDESRSFVRWLDHKYSVHGFIPNAAPDGSDTYAHQSGNGSGPCPEANAGVEVTALHLLAARDYYNATRDLQTLTNAGDSLRYAMDVQLKQAVTNGYRLEFNGDETELAAGDVGPTGYNGQLSHYWSMTSIALCSASLDFYIQYLTAKGANPAAYSNSLDHQVLNLNEELGRFKDALERDYWRTDVPEFPDGLHDWFRLKSDGSWPRAPVVNFALFPIYYGTPLKNPERARNDVYAAKQYFCETTRLLPLLSAPGGRSLGHDLGYLLWGLVAVGDSQQAAVYDALINGPTAGCWGTYNECYDGNGAPNADNGLRSFETGVNISAIAKYWGLGGGPVPETAAASPSIPAGTWVPIDDNHAGITYSGKWTYNTTSPGYYRANCHFSSAPGSYAEYSFTGTAIRWIGSRNDNHGDADVYIDGALRKSVNTRAASWLPQQLLYEESALPNGKHTIKIVVKNEGFQDVDAFVYRTRKPLP
ncbi:hypothetical protein SBV1_410022 [Verrucomicrobia bacterium]|nr:hypothetical protein SBV1_410022 [Verrucomicrobiota bacterium]